jgi:hypothetical protein
MGAPRLFSGEGWDRTDLPFTLSSRVKVAAATESRDLRLLLGALKGHGFSHAETATHFSRDQARGEAALKPRLSTMLGAPS